MVDWYFQSKQTGRRFKVVSFDRKTGDMMLVGEYLPFPQKFDKDLFARLGYQLVKEEEPPLPPTETIEDQETEQSEEQNDEALA